MEQREVRYVRWLVAFAILSAGIGWLGWRLGAPDDAPINVTVTQAPPAPPPPPEPVETPRQPPRPKPPKPRPPPPPPPPSRFAVATPQPVQAEPPPAPPEPQPFSFQGIGAVLRPAENGILIAAVLPGSPAANAGVHAADTILSIDGTSTAGMTIPQATERIRGEAGTSVTIEVDRPGEGHQSMRIERGRIVVDHGMASPHGAMAAPPAPALAR